MATAKTANLARAFDQTGKPAGACAMVLFGAAGDLTKRKLIPALFNLAKANLLPKDFAVVGVARRPLEQSFAADMKEGIEAGRFSETCIRMPRIPIGAVPDGRPGILSTPAERSSPGTGRIH